MTEKLEVRLAGFGGQGIVLSGHILGKAASLFENKNASVHPKLWTGGAGRVVQCRRSCIGVRSLLPESRAARCAGGNEPGSMGNVRWCYQAWWNTHSGRGPGHTGCRAGGG